MEPRADACRACSELSFNSRNVVRMQVGAGQSTIRCAIASLPFVPAATHAATHTHTTTRTLIAQSSPFSPVPAAMHGCCERRGADVVRPVGLQGQSTALIDPASMSAPEEQWEKKNFTYDYSYWSFDNRRGYPGAARSAPARPPARATVHALPGEDEGPATQAKVFNDLVRRNPRSTFCPERRARRASCC